GAPDSWASSPVHQRIPSWYLTPQKLQLLDQLRSNRASLKPLQVQMQEQLENQFSLMQQHQQQMCQQVAAAEGQSRPNRPLAQPPRPLAGLARYPSLNHSAAAPPQPTANGSCAPSPTRPPPASAQPDATLGNNHTLGPGGGGGGGGGGGASNGNVPYPQQNSLPHNCTATSHTSTSSAASSPSHPDDAWRSQLRNTSQGLLKGPGTYLAGPNGEPPFSSCSPHPHYSLPSSDPGALNQVGHSSGPCTASSSASSLSPTSPQTTPQHRSSPPHDTTTSGAHTKDAVPSGSSNGT
ncbi:hypothetical protein CRUP_010140, partial [Coryphaenoides rupestris]